MRLLLDTHIFLWYITGSSRLPGRIRDRIRDPSNEVYLSVVSLWEVLIKHQRGLLELPEPPESFLPKERERHLIASLPVDEASVTQLAKLPALHRDPFDRLLICQAIEHEMKLVTVDTEVKAYPVPLLDLS